MNLGGYSARGPREANEDSFYLLDFSDVDAFTDGIVAFALVSDGMGGYQCGDVASQLTVACAQSYVTQLLEMAEGNKVELDAAAALIEIARNSHEAILEEASKHENASMGATFVGAFLSPTHAWIGHIGDSRAYLVRDGEATQLTEDHSQVGRLLSRGVITEAEAQTHPARNRIERALGFSAGDADIDEVDLEPGDSLLLCSDGVYTVLDATTLGKCVARSRDAASAAKRAVNLALSHGTDDNSTAVVVCNASDRHGTTVRTKTLAGDNAAFQRVATAEGMRPAYEPKRRRSQRVRPTARKTGQAGQVGPTIWADRKRSVETLAIPLIALILLVGMLVVFLMKSQMQEKPLPDTQQVDGTSQVDAQGAQSDGQGTQSDGHQTGGTSSLPVGQQQEGTPSTQQPLPPSKPSDQQNPSAGEQATYIMPWNVELKFIDVDGTAQRFYNEPLLLDEAPELLSGSAVVAQMETDSYGRDGVYHQLSDTYLSDLRRDLALYQDGYTLFNSSLSQLVDREQYLRFIAALSENGQEYIDTQVAHLAIDAIDQSRGED